MATPNSVKANGRYYTFSPHPLFKVPIWHLENSSHVNSKFFIYSLSLVLNPIVVRGFCAWGSFTDNAPMASNSAFISVFLSGNLCEGSAPRGGRQSGCGNNHPYHNMSRNRPIRSSHPASRHCGSVVRHLRRTIPACHQVTHTTATNVTTEGSPIPSQRQPPPWPPPKAARFHSKNHYPQRLRNPVYSYSYSP